ncbi:MAG: rhodanese-like domain-containing protein [Candidatus Dormibacteraeota bacterium]|nr:rhodanese-like domain-containing protein [Candidatus Dormibacteraeota bacterium]
MPEEIHREQVRRLMEQGGQVVEVLPREEYDWLHIAGARSLPLTELTQEAVVGFDRESPVVVYCHDYQ